VPSTASNCSGARQRRRGRFEQLGEALTAALRVEEETPPAVVDPPEALSGGRSLDPMGQLDGAHRKPRVSAATWVMMVRVPVPRS